MKIRLLYIFLLIVGVLLSKQIYSQALIQNNVEYNSLEMTDPSEPKGIFDVTLTSSDPTCYGLCDGFITVNISASPGPIQYPIHLALVNPCDGGDSIIVDGLIVTDFPYTFSNLCGCATQYTVRVKDNDGHRKSRNKGVTNPPELSISDYTVTNLTCPGACDGSVTILNVDNASYPVSYDWSPDGYTGDGTDTYSDLCANTYGVTVTDDIGCTQDTVFILTAPPAIVIDSVVFDAVFCAGSSGTITVYASGGTPPLQYDIGLGFQASNTFSGLAAGTYTITVQDVNLCTTATVPITLTENPALVLSAVVTDVNCFGGSDGAIDLTVVGGTGPFTYSWVGPVPYTFNGQDPLNILAGTYDVTVTDFYGCTGTASYIVNQPTAIVITETHVNPCFGASNGSIDITVVGGTPCPGYTYLWSNAAVTQDLINIPAGTYTVTVTDCNLCTSVFSYTLVQNPQITITLNSQVNYPCFTSGCVGAIFITPSGGTPCVIPPAYTYSWTGPGGFTSTSEDISNLCFGSYTVTVTDCVGCTRTRTITITRPTQITINLISQTNVTCFGLCNGAIDINPTGGTPGYTYLWTGGATTQDVSGLCAGSYTVTVTDTRGCTRTRTFVITEPADITISHTQTDVLCFGACTGAIDVTVGGGTPPYTLYAWSSPNGYNSSSAITPDIINLCAGVYTLTVTDSKPCTKTYSVTITEPAVALSGSITAQTNVLCFGQSNGSVTVAGAGGTPGYTYSLDGGPYQASGTFNGLAAGLYTVTVMDANGCTVNVPVTITQQSALTGSITAQTNVLCFGQSTGSVTVLGSGGTVPYTYSLDGGAYQASGTFNGLSAGAHTVTVMDANGCTANVPVTITQPAVALSGSITAQTNVLCFGQSTGSVTVLGAGGTPGYTYSLDGGAYQASGTFNGLAAGLHTVTVKDANGCTVNVPVTITQPAVALSGSITAQTNVLCFGQSTGSVTVLGAGGTPGYTYSLDGGAYQASGTFNGLAAGLHTVTVKDANGCTVNVPVTITQPAVALSGSITAQTNVLCFGQSTGSVTVSGAGGTPGYTYSLDGGAYQASGTFNGLSSGAHTVTVMDANGCTVNVPVNITQPSALTGSITAQTNVLCFGQSTGSVTVQGANGTPGYTYSLDGGAYVASGTFNGLSAGAHTITVMDANGCTVSVPVTITQPAVALSGSITVQTNVICFGESNGSVTVAGAGGTPGYTYSIDGGAYQASGMFNGLTAGVHTVTVMDANGCTVTVPVTITEPADIILTETHTNIAPCFGNQNGTITITAVGGTPGYLYNIGSGDQLSNFFSALFAGSYNVTVTDAVGCTKEIGPIIIVEPNDISIDSIIVVDVFPCFGDDNGSITVYISGGNPPYVYDIGLGNQPDSIFTNLAPGTYNITVTDALACSTTTGNYTITEPIQLVLTSQSSTNITPCNSDCNGTITVTANGGTPSLTYDLGSGAQATGNFANLCAGSYIVTVTDANGCTVASNPENITEPPLLSITSETHTDVFPCNGDSTGTITIVASGGQGALTYDLGNGGQATGNFIDLIAGTYTVTVTDGLGCTVTSNAITITEPTAIQIDNITYTNVTGCFGNSDGTITIIASGGTIPLSFDLGLGGQPTGNFVGLPAGTYIITITDDNGCTVVAPPVIITEPTDIAIDSDSYTDVSPCFGGNNGTITVIASGGTGVLTYDIGLGGQPTGNFIGLVAGTYVVTVTDILGCTETDTLLINEPPALQITALSKTDIAPCFGDSSGTISITVIGGTPPYTYDVGFGSTNVSPITGLPVGTYNVTVTDNVGCTIISDTLIIIEPPALSSSFPAFTQVACGNTCTGALTVAASGGTPPYVSYVWNPNVGAGPSLTNLCAGIYSVTITDNLGCTTSNSFEITDTSNLQLNLVSSTNPTCFGLCDGTAILAATGGYPPYTWPDCGPTCINLCDSIYLITVIDDSSCSRQIQVTIIEPLQLSFTTSVTSPVCASDCNGTATASVTGGTPPYSYLWDVNAGSQTDSTAINLCPGTYDVTVTDSNNCFVASQQVTITSPPILTGTLDITQNIACNSVCNGILTANPSGGIGPYTFEWSHNILETAQIADSLCADTFFVTVTDAIGCSIILTDTLDQPTQVIATITDSTLVGCHGNCSGTATVDGSGGVAPYTYLWDSNAADQTTPIAINLCGGIYFVTVTDFNGCSDSTMVTIIDTSNLSLDTVSVIHPRCTGDCNGEITVIATGGYPSVMSPFYTYSWDDGQSGPIATGLCAGDHIVTVVDDSLCSRTILITLINPPVLTSDSTGIIPITCSSACDGSAIIFASGGTGTLTYLWDDLIPQTNDTASSLCQGTYHVTVTDINGCTVTDSVSLVAPPVLDATLSVSSPILCYSNCNGQIVATVTGGTPPYTYAWSNLMNTDTISNLCTGTYILTLTDANLCQVIDTMVLSEPDSLQLTFNKTDAFCGECNATATAVVIGGTVPYYYQWDVNADNDTTSITDSLCVNFYFITVTDDNGCTVNGVVEIIDTSNLNLSITDIHNISCFGSCDGSATAIATGGYPYVLSPNYNYSWNTVPVQNDTTAINLCTGFYIVTVVDSLQCSRVDSVTISDAFILQDSLVVQNIGCTGGCDGIININPSGGIPGYTYQWSPNTTDTTAIVTGLCAGTYYFTFTDSNGCSVSDSATIIVPPVLSVALNLNSSISCYGICDAEVEAIASDGVPPYTFQWSTADTTSIVDSLCAAMLYVTVTDAGTCVVVDSIDITQPDSIVISFINVVQVGCGGDSTGSVTASVIGGTPLYSYLWDANADNATTAMIDSIPANLYFITVTDANGCTQSSSFELTDTSQLNISLIDSGMVSCYGRCDGWATIGAAGGIMPYVYVWSNNDTIPTADSLCAGQYTVTVYDDSLCSRVRLVEITQPDSILILISDSSIITCASLCNGSLTASATGGTMPYSYNWNNSITDTLAIVTDLCSGNQQVNLTDANGCQDSLFYYLPAPPVIVDTLDPQSALCSNGTNDGSILGTITGGMPPYTYLWSNDSTTIPLLNLAAGTYWLTITDSLGCQKTDSAIVGAGIIVDATARWDTIICYGDSVQIEGYGSSIFTWSPTTGLSDSTVFNPWTHPTQNTTYYFTAFNNICFDVDSVTIQVYQQIGVDAGPDVTILFDHSTTITATSLDDPFITYLWTPATGLEDTSSASTVANPEITTTYLVFATNPYGCVDVDTMIVTVIPQIIVPNGITPNGDGKNDVWMIDLIGYYPNCEVYIFNRWGEQLFYSQGYPDSERWDGTYNGKPLPTGTYYFIIDLHDEVAETPPITGPITIMR